GNYRKVAFLFSEKNAVKKRIMKTFVNVYETLEISE
ncbi:unnamed protein product, partial [marine sediment metagenome]